ncbi:MAG: hypothetical protein IT497_04435 [Ottowia sp.]|nr:hypothetical protein [Ottowia sp.]
MDAVKKLTLIAAAVGALGQGVAMAADGTVNFTGSVTASACVVTGGAAGGVITVPMGSVSSKAFTGVGGFVRQGASTFLADAIRLF